MKRLLIITITIGLMFSADAGNPDRIGESGANELVMNGWARSTGLWDMNTAHIRGIESIRLNPAGLALGSRMEIAFAQTLWLQGSDVQISQAGFSQRLGTDNFIGFTLFSLNLGDIDRTRVNQPDPNNGLGTFRPTLLNLGLTFARAFSNSIYGGATIRIINEGVGDARASGVALDAGLRYVTGPKDNLQFGVSIRNLGTPMKFKGDGFTFRSDAPDGDDYELTLSHGTNKFELPSLLTVGAAYDIWMGPEYVCNGAQNFHRLTVLAAFTSNSFGKDNFGGGVEYAFKEMFMLRGGYRHEKDIMNPDERTTAYTGFSGGMSLMVPFSNNGPGLGIDYSYRSTASFKGTHSIGIRFVLGDGDDCNPVIPEPEEKDAFVEEEKVIERKEVEEQPIKLTKKEVKQIEKISAAIEFKTGSDQLTEDAKEELKSLAEFMNKRTEARIKISAHTDNVGTEEDNLTLSQDRAISVKTFLTDHSVSEERIETVAYGEAKPIATNNTEEGKAKNRRVELEVF